MRLAFHYRAPFTKQLALQEAVKQGAAKLGDEIVEVQGFHSVRSDVDGLVMLGIGGHSREVFDAYLKAGKRVLFFDKGYTRGGGWYRFAVDAFNPTGYLDKVTPAPARIPKLVEGVHPYRNGGTHILLDGASNKFCLWQGLGDWIEWGAKMVFHLRQHTRYPIIYRPRPSHNPSVPVAGADLSERPLADDLARARVVVSYGGNIGFDAVVAGRPHFAIGDSIARPLSETDWTRVDRPRIPSHAERSDWLARVANCQLRLEELSDGSGWRQIRKQMDAVRAN